MGDLAELAVAGAIAVAVNLLVAAVIVLCVMAAPLLRSALDAVREAFCRLVGGGYGFVGRTRPRRKPPP